MPLSAVSPSAFGARGLLWDGLRASLRENSPIYLLIALSLVGADSLSAWVGTPHRSLDRIGYSYDGYVAICVTMLAVAFII